MASLSERLEFAQQYRQERVHYEPRMRPLVNDDLFCTSLPGEVYDRELEALKLQELSFSHMNVLSTAEIRTCIRSAEREGLVDDLKSRILDAVRSESRALDTLDEVEALGEVYLTSVNGNPVGSINNLVPVTWNASDIYGMPEVRGRYFLEAPRIDIYAPLPRVSAVVSTLCVAGVLPWPLQTYGHEKLHALQYNVFRGEAVPELFEAQAHRTSMDERGTQSHDLLVKDLVDSPAYEDLDPKKFDAAIWVIDRLNALGLSQKKAISVIKQPGNWNGFGCWDGLEDFIRAEMKRREINSEDLERELMAYNLKRTIETHKARLAACFVMYLEFRDIIDLRRRVDSRLRRGDEEQYTGEAAVQRVAV